MLDINFSDLPVKKIVHHSTNQVQCQPKASEGAGSFHSQGMDGETQILNHLLSWTITWFSHSDDNDDHAQ